MKRAPTIAIALLVLFFLVAAVAASQFNLSALPEPGRAESYLATKAKRFLIYRASRGAVPPPPADLQASIKEGDKLFGTECSQCHGLDGHKATDAGRWMYPRAADLTSPDVQRYSDRELFWILKNGVRLSGMPGFGSVEPDDHIWNLVHFVRTLPGSANPKAGVNAN
jgi:mono/diheme cytochrome c family protein